MSWDGRDTLAVMSTELDGLPPNALALSSVAGAGGLFTHVSTRWSEWGVPLLTLGDSLAAPDDGASIGVWLLRTLDRVTFEYGVISANVSMDSADLTDVGSIDGIWYDGATATLSAYAFDLTDPTALPVSSYVNAAPSGTTVTLALPALKDGTDHMIAFAAPPSRTPDFLIPVGARTFMPGEALSGMPAQGFAPRGIRFKVLVQNLTSVPLPASGNLLNFGIFPEDPSLELERIVSSPGLVRILDAAR